ncbi:signal transduction histidine kinase [Beggiatoa alba B18LD]|uniref:Sensory/regulatory protein RpfC n=1 Tax=Beggiatoa alba B18LD TaxID=395493 RepID=I3CGN5_9GAMM|nr:hybrid sensor histidine kinase/response regulator [Beggiatoa alba]EIJ42778.1 signal transduction histidine kinase [Beggiatoa alba B18LD]
MWNTNAILEKTTHYISAFPLRIILTVPFLIQLVLTASLVAWLSFSNGQEAIEKLSKNLRSEITKNIQDNLASYLSTPLYIVQSNLTLVKQGFFKMQDLKQWEVFFREQIHTYKTVNSLAMANEEKDFLAIRRIENEKFSFALSSQKTQFNLINYDYYTNEEIARSNHFDPRTRSWYTNPMTHHGLYWSDIFIALDTSALQLTASIPVIDHNEKPLGILASTLRLDYISDFLSNLKQSQTGQMFVIERKSGLLVASSTEEELFKMGDDNTKKRLNVMESHNNLTRYTAQSLLETVSQFTNITEEQQFDITWSGEHYFLQVTPYKDNYGLDWLIVVLIPESDFMAQIHESTRITIILSLLALLVAIFIGFLTTRWIISPITELNHAAQTLANGDWQSQPLLQISRQDELGELANSFQQMAQQLRISFKNLEDEIIARTQAQASAEAANRAKSTFLATMSHELRTPLNGILGYTQILEDDENLTALQQEGIQTIQRSGEYLLTLINDILDLTRIEANRLEIYPTNFNLIQLLEGLVSYFTNNAQQKNVSFWYEVLTPLPRFICTDEKRLRQILINLLSNAIKFTHRGGITFCVSYQGDCLHFQVKDTGIGIAADDLKHICEPFKQVGDPKYRPDGTGLGLAITKHLLEMLGGELKVNSEVGKGSCFSFILHLPEVAEHEIEKFDKYAMVTGYVGIRRKILVIDDHWENRELLCNLLRPLGFDVFEAINGLDGIEKAKQYYPDLVITDFVMPVMDGFEVIRQIRKLPELKNIPIVADSSSLLDDSFSFTINAFLSKPIKIEELLNVLSELLGLTWIYAGSQPHMAVKTIDPLFTHDDKEQLITPQAIPLPSVFILQSLHELATMGHINGIFKQLNTLENEDTEQVLQPFIHQIRQLAKGFQLDEICQLIEEYVKRVNQEK